GCVIDRASFAAPLSSAKEESGAARSRVAPGDARARRRRRFSIFMRARWSRSMLPPSRITRAAYRPYEDLVGLDPGQGADSAPVRSLHTLRENLESHDR